MTHSPFPWTRDDKGTLRDAKGKPVCFAGLTAFHRDAADRHPKIAANTALVEAIPAMREALDHVRSALRGDITGAMREALLQIVDAAIEKANRS